MSCYQRELPDEVIFIEAEGKSPQLIYDLLTEAIEKLKTKGMTTVIQKSNAIGQIPIRSKTSEVVWVDPGCWFVYGFLPL